jgi:DNA-directed RNA polymerase alpha subunit
MPHFYDTCAGPIEGLYLPPIAWEVLRRENIDTVDQLRANADSLEQLDGIGSRMAHVIRQELARFTPPEEQASVRAHFDAWTA